MKASPTIRLADDLTLPLDVVVQRIAVLGKTGRGKTYTSKRIVEEALRAGVPVVVIDPVDAWWGLRAGADGTAGAGLDVIVFGGRHGDLPLNERAGKMLARLALDGRSMVLVGKGMSKAARRRLVAEFLTELYDHAAGRPLLVVIDEADEYAPQSTFGQVEVAKCLGAVDEVVRRGRGAGLGSLLISQRPAVLNKDVLEQVDVLVIHGLTGKNDINAIDVWVGKHADNDELAREIKLSLPPLPRGTAWVWAPELGILQRAEMLPIGTFDSSKTPKVGEVVIEPKARKPINLDALGAELASYAEQVKADDPAQLRARIRDLARQLRDQPAAEPETIPVPVLTDADRGLLIAVVEAMTTGLQPWWDSLRQLLAQVDPLFRKIEHSGVLTAAPGPAPAAVATARRPPAARPAPTAKPSVRRPQPGSEPATLSKGERAVLTALAQFGTCSKTRVALLTNYSSRGGGFNNVLGALRTAGRIEGRHELTITQDGIDALGGYEPLPAGKELLDMWLAKLGRAERAILEQLASSYPDPLSKEQVAEATGYTATGGGFNNAVGRLRTLDLIAGPSDALRMSDNLVA